MTTEDTSQMPLFSPEDEKEAQKELDRLRKRLRENENGAINVNRKLNRKRTGFEDKTLWDWLQLLGVLAIPLILGIATLLFGIQQAHLADLQHQSDQRLAQQQHLSDQQNTLDQQRQATLVTYLDNIRDLLLNRGLLTSTSSDEIRVIARTETLSAMRQLDGKRNIFLLQFLQDTHLIGFDSSNIVNFEKADLSSAKLSGTNLSFADLSGADLSGADLNGADLNGTNLSHAFLNSADLSRAFLLQTNLSHAFLNSADLSRAFLGLADLSGSNITQRQLDQVFACDSAILPPGLTCPHNQ